MDCLGEKRHLPEAFEFNCYRSLSRDLDIFDDAAVHPHYLKYGLSEGRRANHLVTRRDFVALIPPEAETLEIGPFHNALLSGPRVCFFDVLTTPGLVERARSHGVTQPTVPLIDFVSPTGDLSIVDRSFDYVVSSHCLEHQPDFLSHLLQVERLLRPGGRYFVLVPDKRYCFDAFIGESTIADVLEAYAGRRKTHLLKSLIEHRALTTHNDPRRHWAGDHGDNQRGQQKRIAAAMLEYEAAAGRYLDVHAWYFTPASAQQTLAVLRELDLLTLVVERLYPTRYNSNEFWMVLTKPEQPATLPDTVPPPIASPGIAPRKFASRQQAGRDRSTPSSEGRPAIKAAPASHPRPAPHRSAPALLHRTPPADSPRRTPA